MIVLPVVLVLPLELVLDEEELEEPLVGGGGG